MIHILNRHCTFSNLSGNKPRPSWFSREACFKNLLNTLKGYEDKVKLHILFDGNKIHDFLKQGPVNQFNAGTGAKSFLVALDYAMQVVSDPNDTIYFLEDDYLHKPNWVPILEEGIDLDPNGYVSLYDHSDKYPGSEEFITMYSNLTSSILVSKSLHWRTVSSTTDTFAITKKNLQKTINIHRHYSSLAHHSLDHDRGMYLTTNKILTLRTCMPGYATHAEIKYQTPLTDWQKIKDQTT